MIGILYIVVMMVSDAYEVLTTPFMVAGWSKETSCG